MSVTILVVAEARFSRLHLSAAIDCGTLHDQSAHMVRPLACRTVVIKIVNVSLRTDDGDFRRKDAAATPAQLQHGDDSAERTICDIRCDAIHFTCAVAGVRLLFLSRVIFPLIILFMTR